MRFFDRWSLLSLAGLLALAAIASCSLEPPLRNIPDKEIEVAGGGIGITLHSLTGRVRSLRQEDSGFELLEPWPDSDTTAWFGVEIEDELTGSVVCDYRDSILVRDLTELENNAVFDKEIVRTGLHLRQEVWGDREGIGIQYTASLDEGEPLRSVCFTFVVPLQHGLTLWAPSGDEPVRIDGRERLRFVYGPGPSDEDAVALPLVALWRDDGAALSLSVPLDIRCVRVSFTVEPNRTPPSAATRLEESPFLRITWDLVGIGGGRSLETGLWIYQHEPGWRSSLASFSSRYADFFEPPSRVTNAEGFVRNLRPAAVTTSELLSLQRSDVRLAKIDWNIFRSGEWVPPQALRFDDFTWTAGSIPPEEGVSVRAIRSTLENLAQFKMRAMMHTAYNAFCDEDLAKSRFGDDMAVDENGELLRDELGRVLMHASETSPFGTAMLDQQRRMLELYSQASCYFLDDWSVFGVDFAHDDSLTVVHHKPAYNLAFNRGSAGLALVRLLNQERKLTFSRPPATVSGSRDVDAFCIRPEDLSWLPAASFMALNRPMVADMSGAEPLTAARAEEILKTELLYGVMPSEAELSAEGYLSRAYRPLFDQLRGRRLVLEPGVLGLPPGVDGQVYSVPTGGRSLERDYVVTLVRGDLRLAEGVQRPGGTAMLRVPTATEPTRAVFMSASTGGRPVPLRIERETIREEYQRLTIDLPAFGAAAVLRLSRQ